MITKDGSAAINLLNEQYGALVTSKLIRALQSKYPGTSINDAAIAILNEDAGTSFARLIKVNKIQL